MKLSIITLDRRTIKVEMSDSQDVRTLKQRLSNMPEVAMPADSLQLIYAGRIMEDELPLSNYKIAEDKNIVLMGKKIVPPPKEQEQERKPEPVPGIPTAPPAAGANEAHSQPTVALPSIAPNEQRVRDLMEMGYGEQEVRDALRASFNHPERAIEYLISGIPPQAATEAQMSAAQQTGDPHQMVASPALTRVRQMIRDDPRLLDQILAHLAETEPEAFEIIRNHQAEFMALIQGSDNDTGGETVQVNLNADEAAAVGRLEALGFQRALAVQAYLACDKNEEMAAMILFNQAEEDEDHDQEQLP
ncbi:UV excision repair protein RAD23 homolog A [Drosophila serrata]|uniref:UV excision repair protein RAD23 homolog A n=1 Tax=Drosophila serrata TaxID=7274 RepID=UPI000A1D3411|nr:UV excision repair protein RAD23 homolog A [Drosophila serrata]KAH8392658.1 hypothetical protein KR200_005865 [Drosophila serrata]